MKTIAEFEGYRITVSDLCGRQSCWIESPSGGFIGFGSVDGGGISAALARAEAEAHYDWGYQLYDLRPVPELCKLAREYLEKVSGG